jgi:hypothetical protein
MSEISLLLEIAQQSSQWLAAVLTSKRRKEEAQAAVVLREAGMLTAGLRALGSSWRTTMSKLLLVTPDWTEAQRAGLKAEILSYLMEEVVLGEIRKAHATLREYVWRPNVNEDLRASVRVLLTSGSQAVDAVTMHEWTPLDELNRLLDQGVSGSGKKSEAQQLMKAIDPRSIAAAESAFGQLKATVLARYPTLPEPTWAARSGS